MVLLEVISSSVPTSFVLYLFIINVPNPALQWEKHLIQVSLKKIEIFSLGVTDKDKNI